MVAKGVINWGNFHEILNKTAYFINFVFSAAPVDYVADQCNKVWLLVGDAFTQFLIVFAEVPAVQIG